MYKINNLSDEEATLVEPAACAVHGMDQLAASVGVEALIIGAGPTGLILAQLLKLNGAVRVVVAANKGIKLDLAKSLDAGHEYIELDRESPDAQWEELKKKNPFGFDVVVKTHPPIHAVIHATSLTARLGRSRPLARRRSPMTPSTTFAAEVLS